MRNRIQSSKHIDQLECACFLWRDSGYGCAPVRGYCGMHRRLIDAHVQQTCGVMFYAMLCFCWGVPRHDTCDVCSLTKHQWVTGGIR
jgi:hypothetical protein